MERKKFQISWDDLSKYRTEIYGISALWIMIFHIYLVDGHSVSDNFFIRFITTMIRKGNMGVEIFLFLSGCFLYYSFESCNKKLITFEKRRVTRLFLPVLLINVPYWIILLLDSGDIGRFALRVSFLEFWINGNQMIWFVSMIFICYLLYPFFYELFFESKYRKLILFLVLIYVILTTFSIFVKESSYYAVFNIGVTRFPIFIIGCWCGKLCKEKKEISYKTILLSCLIILASIYIYMFKPLSGIWGRYIYLSSIAYIIVFVWVLKIFNCKWINKFLRFFGNMSLELYLSQILMIDVYKVSSVYEEGNVRNYFLLLGVVVIHAKIISEIEKLLKKRVSLSG